MSLWARCNFDICITLVALLSCMTLQGAQPVLVELFTSEGCSSCPPADSLLQRLERGQLVPGVQVIALSEHVDYWNHLGWSDPFSSAQMTSRQQGYAARFRKDGPYTPQMVVDGVEEFVGSDAAKARRAIAIAANRQKLDVTAELESSGTLHLKVPGSPSNAEVFVAVVYDPEPSAVARGENSGRRLVHVSVVKSLKRLGEVGHTRALDLHFPVLPDSKLANERVVAFVQERGQGRVLGSVEVSARQSAGIVARWSPQK
jgi:hypothetical protein